VCSKPPEHRWCSATSIILESVLRDSFCAFRAGLALLPDDFGLKFCRVVLAATVWRRKSIFDAQLRKEHLISRSDAPSRQAEEPQFFRSPAKEYNPAFPEVAVKRWIVFLAALVSLLWMVSASWAQKSAPAPVTIIRAGVLIDGVSDSPRRDVIITIRGNKITDVADGGKFPISIPTDMQLGSTLVDLSQATVLPGLIDAHTHIFLQGEDPAEGGYDIQLLKYPLAFRAARATVSVRRALE